MEGIEMTDTIQEHELQRKKSKRSYEEILDEARSISKKTIAVFIPELCQALKDEDPELSNKEIQDKVLEDCEGIWVRTYIQHFWPDWIRNQEFLKRAHAGQKGKQARKSSLAFEQQREDSLKQVIKTFNRIPEPVILPEEPEEEDNPIISTEVVGITEPEEKELPTPLELYEHGVKSAEKLWTALTNKDKLIASDTIDVLIEHIKPTRQFRLRMFKGLDQARALHYQMVLIWLDKLIQDTLRDCLEMHKESKNEITK